MTVRCDESYKLICRESMFLLNFHISFRFTAIYDTPPCKNVPDALVTRSEDEDDA